MSVREITKEQFAAGTSIDGDRLEGAMADLEGLINAMPDGYFEQRFTQSQFVSGHLPDLSAGVLRLPFMDTGNDATQLAPGGLVPSEFENPKRIKGDFVDSNVDSQYALTLAAYFRAPVIVTQVDWVLLSDSTFDNDWIYGTPLAAGKTGGQPVDDFTALLTVDSPWRIDDQSMNHKVLARHNFQARSELFNRGGVPGGFADFRPAHPAGGADGVIVHLRDINVPIPRDSRVRWSLVLPHWANNAHPWDARPWQHQYYTVVLTVLEPLEE